MQTTQQLLLELEPDAKFEWGPMDNGANYPFILLRDGRKVLLYRFSKDSLAALGDGPHQSKVRDLLRQALRTDVRQIR
ncbi:MAG: hypothetical protein ACO1SX_11510 [Actinomycetota bacterium]